MRAAAAAIVGGLGSRLAGGDFESGAITAAFARMFNDDNDHDSEHDSESAKEAIKIFKKGVGLLTALKKFTKFFEGLGGGRLGNAAAGAGGSLVKTGISALDVDVAEGNWQLGIRKNINICLGEEVCHGDEDEDAFTSYLTSNPPNIRAVAELFQMRGWKYLSPIEILLYERSTN